MDRLQWRIQDLVEGGGGVENHFPHGGFRIAPPLGASACRHYKSGRGGGAPPPPPGSATGLYLDGWEVYRDTGLFSGMDHPNYFLK